MRHALDDPFLAAEIGDKDDELGRCFCAFQTLEGRRSVLVQDL